MLAPRAHAGCHAPVKRRVRRPPCDRVPRDACREGRSPGHRHGRADGPGGAGPRRGAAARAARRPHGAAAPGPPSSPASASRMGLMPLHGAQEIATSPSIPVLYHGGSVMRNVTIHTVFWAPAGYRYDGSPGGGALGYVPLIQQFFADVAHDSGSTANVFSLLNQYGDHSGVGNYQIHYDAAVDSVADTHPYPAATNQCPSPVRGRHLRHRPPGPARGGQADRRRRSGGAGADQHLLRPAAAGRRRVHHRSAPAARRRSRAITRRSRSATG